MELICHSHANKTHCHNKGCAHLNLIMKVRVFGTRKWPISTVNNELAYSRLSDGNDDALVNGTRKSEREPGKREWWRKKKEGSPSSHQFPPV